MTTTTASSITASLPTHLQPLTRLPPDVTRILYIKSLPFTITPTDLYDIFGRYGTIRQLRLGTTPATRGRAYVVYEDVWEAVRAVEGLNGFNVMGRYLVVLYWKGDKDKERERGGGGGGGGGVKEELERKKAEIERMKQTFGVDGGSGET